ncbi:MAG: hypothetical protein FJ104_11000, partial [Deltaproteobacteria bacterium]|nr:hypothetical protein [Deltaproteobacteria bacterium]
MSQSESSQPGAPRQVGRYELTERHLPGAGAERWRGRVATGAELGRRISLRSIPRSAELTAQAVERLSNAGFAAMELRHPKIAAVLDVVVADAEVAIVSEDLAGMSLQELLRPADGQPRTQTPPDVAARMVLDLLDALSAVAEPWAEVVPPPETDEERILLGALHGGVTPDTLLVATFGETLLLEPGISGAALTLPAIGDHPEIIAFRAPEQLEPGRAVDERADLFTAGVVAWELVAGRSLFAAASLPRPPGSPTPPRASGQSQVAGAKRRVLTAPILRLDGLPGMKGKVGKPFADWVARCLERDPAKRFPTIVGAVDALRALGASAIATHDAVAAFVAARSGAVAADDAAPVSSGAL